MKSLILRLLPLFVVALLPMGALGQEGGGGAQTNRSTMSEHPSTPRESRPTPPPPPDENRFGWMLFPGMILLYFALQMWILPKMGVST
jgi:hypothetical protein